MIRHTFTWRLWRLGYAAPGVVHLQGWRRLAGRLWWRTLRPIFARARAVPSLAPPRVRAPLHWAPSDGLPICGASDRSLLWTFQHEDATCPLCVQLGRGMVLQHRVNTR